MELNPSDEAILDAICNGSPRSQGIRNAIRLVYSLRGLTNGSKLLLKNPDGTEERILLL